MRNYWLKIFLGAFAIFAVGMIITTVVRGVMDRVKQVVASEGPLEIPLAFVPFVLGDERLGTIKGVVLQRDAPRRVSSVELRVDVGDTLLAQGLQECRLAADFEGRPGEPGVNIRAGKDSGTPFRCLTGDSVPADLVEFGEAILEPGEVRIPLYLKQDLVAELREGLAGDSAAALSASEADSIAEETRRQVDSALAEVGLGGESAGRAGRRLGDSLRAAARARLDSLRRSLDDMADSMPGR